MLGGNRSLGFDFKNVLVCAEHQLNSKKLRELSLRVQGLRVR